MVASIGAEVEDAVIGADVDDAMSVASLEESASTSADKSVAGANEWRPVAAGLEAALMARAPGVHTGTPWSASSPTRSAACWGSTITSGWRWKSARACATSG